MSQMTLKTDAEIEIIAAGGRILANALQATAALVRPGVSTLELDSAAEREIRKAGGEPSFKGYGKGKDKFPFALCTSVNQIIVHGTPSAKDVLKEGDIIGLDLGVRYKGLYTDAAITVPVGRVSAAAQKLLRVTEEALDLAIGEARVGNRIGDISAAIQRTAERAGFGAVRQLIGHGVGHAVHEEPAVPCFGKAGEGLPLEAGMVLAIEPMVTEGDYHLVTEAGWPVMTRDKSLGAHFEHTVAITPKGPRILTLLG